MDNNDDYNDFLQMLEGLPQDQALQVARFFQTQLEVRVGMLLSDGLSDEQMSQFESLMNRDVEKMTEWIDRYAPDYEDDEIYLSTRADYEKNAERAGTKVDELALLSRYAQLKWFSINRPDYQEVVKRTVRELYQLVKANLEAFVSAALQGTDIDPESGFWVPPTANSAE